MIPWWITLISAIVPSLITAFVSLKISRKSHIQKNNEKIDELSKEVTSVIGDLSFKKSIVSMLGNDDPDKKSLSGQHDILLSAIETETRIIEQRRQESEQRYRQFTAEQHNTKMQIEQFKLFMEDWERLTSIVSEQQSKINLLEKENDDLRTQLCENNLVPNTPSKK